MYSKAKVVLNRIFSPKYLLVTNTVCCSCLLGTGDLIQQKLSKALNEKKTDYDFKRTGTLPKTVSTRFYFFDFIFSQIRISRAGPWSYDSLLVQMVGWIPTWQ